MSARGGIVSVRRNHLIRSIHNLQTEQLKSNKRESLMNTLNPPADVYRLKQLLQNYNIQYFPLEILQVHSHSSVDTPLNQEIYPQSWILPWTQEILPAGRSSTDNFRRTQEETLPGCPSAGWRSCEAGLWLGRQGGLLLAVRLGGSWSSPLCLEPVPLEP